MENQDMPPVSRIWLTRYGVPMYTVAFALGLLVLLRPIMGEAIFLCFWLQ